VHPAFSTGPLAWQLRPQALLRGVLNISYSCKLARARRSCVRGRGLLTGVMWADAHLTLPARSLLSGWLDLGEL